MPASPLIERLVEGLRCLPGVGPKSARRMAFHLLQHNREGGRRLAQVMLRRRNADVEAQLRAARIKRHPLVAKPYLVCRDRF